MLVYRVEDDEYQGPYWPQEKWPGCRSMYNSHSKRVGPRHRPNLVNDGIAEKLRKRFGPRPGPEDPIVYCGLESYEATRRWFMGYMRPLTLSGYLLSVYLVPESQVIRGRSDWGQLVFWDADELVKRVPLVGGARRSARARSDSNGAL